MKILCGLAEEVSLYSRSSRKGVTAYGCLLNPVFRASIVGRESGVQSRGTRVRGKFSTRLARSGTPPWMTRYTAP